MAEVPELVSTSTISQRTDAVVVGAVAGDDVPLLVGVPTEVKRGWRRQFGVPIQALAADLGATGEAGTVTVLPTNGYRIVVVGLGEDAGSAEQLRRSVGAGVRALAGRKDADNLTVAVSLDASTPDAVRAIAEGALLGAYQIAQPGHERTQKIARVEIVASGRGMDDAVARARVVAAAVWQTRDWINAPANLLYPESFADEASALAKQAKVAVEVLDEKALAAKGYGGILAVGGGSAHGPRLVRLDYSPRGAKQHLVLVGKGITFDSGGLNIKTADGMYTMKCDMSGAAAVLAATTAIAQLGLKVHVTAYAAMAENMPSGTAYHPSDVLTMYGGLTVENANTDAEGRLVMADALARGSEDKPDLMVDVATLTGACMVALGDRIGGLMATDDDTADALLDAADDAGEMFWQLPLPEFFSHRIESKIADVKSGGGRDGGAIVAGTFLRRFVADGISWAHLDIAGPAFNNAEPYDDVPAGGTGFGVRTLVSLAAALEG